MLNDKRIAIITFFARCFVLKADIVTRSREGKSSKARNTAVDCENLGYSKEW